ncbi:hypothetical protein G6F65_021769 [Rhizopus arrhizus]|nr:hypothetical protein G6F65_021769 [Rhizopus arrhizus]
MFQVVPLPGRRIHDDRGVPRRNISSRDHSHRRADIAEPILTDNYSAFIQHLYPIYSDANRSFAPKCARATVDHDDQARSDRDVGHGQCHVTEGRRGLRDCHRSARDC